MDSYPPPVCRGALQVTNDVTVRKRGIRSCCARNTKFGDSDPRGGGPRATTRSARRSFGGRSRSAKNRAIAAKMGRRTERVRGDVPPQSENFALQTASVVN